LPGDRPARQTNTSIALSAPQPKSSLRNGRLNRAGRRGQQHKSIEHLVRQGLNHLKRQLRATQQTPGIVLGIFTSESGGLVSLLDKLDGMDQRILDEYAGADAEHRVRSSRCSC